jgi:pilus assembly protein FimV
MALAMAFATPAALALGLGQMQVKSGLNQPLVAEIPIISATPAELNELDVRLASPEAFSAVGLERPLGLSANLQFSVGKNASGQPVVRVTTPGRFNDPLLTFLIEAKWATGSVTREYTALIDPPFIAPAVVRPMSAPAIAVETPPAAAPMASAPEPAATEPAAPAQPAPAETAPASEPEPAMAASPMPEPAVAEQPPGPTPQQVLPPPRKVPPALRSLSPAPAPEPAPVETPKPSGDYGPVIAGKTLWSIANEIRPDTNVSVNQVMLALLRNNPEAFNGSNINRLKQGAVLRIPSRDEIATLSPDQAAALVHEQAAAWQSSSRPTMPQPAEGVAQSTPAPASAVASAPPPRPAARLEIVPPSGKASARGTQSGAAAGGGGSELRAELLQTNEELAARTAEVTELKSRVSDLEKQQADRQHLIDLQNSQLKDLQTRLQQKEAQPTAAAAAPPAAASAAPAESSTPEAPLYLNPYILGGGGLILIGGLVFAMRRKPAKAGVDETTSRRISDDEALRASLAKTRAAVVKPIAAAPTPRAPEPPMAASGDPELDARVQAVAQNPKDLEAHLNLLRLHHARGNAVEYEAAAQAMRGQIPSTLDPRWREAVIMGASLMPGHVLFNQAGWNAPRFDSTESTPRPVTAVEKMLETPAATPPKPSLSVFDLPEEEQAMAAPVEDSHDDSHLGSIHSFDDGGLDLIDAPGDLADAIPAHLEAHQEAPDEMQDDEASATRIELAKAYLDIGDLDGARSMLEEVLAEGGPAAQAEAERILREIG